MANTPDMMIWPASELSLHARMGDVLARLDEAQGAWRMLLVGVDTIVPTSLRIAFAEHRLQLTCSNEAEAAIKALSGQPFDLVVVQIGVNAAALAEVLECALRQPCKLLVLLCQDHNFDIQWALDNGVFACLHAPCNTSELFLLCRQAIRQLRLESTCADLSYRLEKSHAVLRVVRDSSPSPTYILDRNGHFIFVDDRLESLLGYRRNGLMDRHYSTVIYKEDWKLASHVFDSRAAAGGFYRNVDIRLQGASHMGQGVAKIVEVELLSYGIYTDSGQDRFIGVYGVVRDMAARKALENTVHFQAYHDSLTKLPTRALFRDRLDVALAQARRNDKRLAVLFLDLDKFKKINDTLGHPVGDRVLQIVANRLRSCLRQSDILARVGGDEFALLLPEISSKENASAIADKIVEQLQVPAKIDDAEVHVGASIGIAIYPESGENMEDMISHADLAMYYAKGSGKSKHQVFSNAMTRGAKRRQQVEKDLRTALDTGQFSVCYQPQVDLASGKIIAVEAHARWHHPKRGLIQPENFLSVAEQTGLITEVNAQVHSSAFADMLSWQNQHLPKVRLSFNLSAFQIAREDFPGEFIASLMQSELANDLVEVEIMEEAIMQEVASLAPKLRRMSHEGIRIAVGRFGAAYFSLFYLQRFPIGTLKVDRAFIRDIHGHEKESVMKGMVAMAHALSIRIVAEGVETRNQIEYLQSISCDSAQGVFFGSPRNASEMIGLLKEQPWVSSDFVYR